MFRSLKCGLVLFCMVLAGSAFAIQPTSLEQRGLILLVDKLNNAIDSGNYDAVVQNMPKRLANEMAVRLHVSEETLRKSQKEQLQKQFGMLGKGAFKMDGSAIEYEETPKGPFYALVPVRIETDRAIIEDKILFLYDDGGWHIIFGGKKIVQNPIFQQIYPFFENITLPMEKIDLKDKSQPEGALQKG